MDKGISRDELEAIRDNYTELVESFSTEYTRLENQNKEQAAEIDRLTELVEMQNKEYIELDNECREQKTEIERLTALVEKISVKKSVIETKGVPLCKTCPELKDCPHADNRTSCWEYDEIVKQSDSRLDAIRDRAEKLGAFKDNMIDWAFDNFIKDFEERLDIIECETSQRQSKELVEDYNENEELAAFKEHLKSDSAKAFMDEILGKEGK